jgi:predicted transposase YdaD
MENCSELKEYADFIKIIRDNKAKGISRNEAVNLAIRQCIQNDIMADYLNKNQERIHNMYTAPEEYAEYLLEKGIEQGIEKGIEKGIEQGIVQGLEKGIEKGIEQGIEKTNFLIVQNMLSQGLSLSLISNYTGISVKQIEIFRDKLPQISATT